MHPFWGSRILLQIRVPGPFAQRSYILFTVKGPRRVVYVISFLGMVQQERSSQAFPPKQHVVLKLDSCVDPHNIQSCGKELALKALILPDQTIIFIHSKISFYRQCCIKSTGTAWCFQFQASGRAVPFASSSTSLLQI